MVAPEKITGNRAPAIKNHLSFDDMDIDKLPNKMGPHSEKKKDYFNWKRKMNAYLEKMSRSS